MGPEGLPHQNLGSDNKNASGIFGIVNDAFTTPPNWDFLALLENHTTYVGIVYEPARIRTPVRRSEAGCTIQAILRALGLLLFVEGI